MKRLTGLFAVCLVCVVAASCGSGAPPADPFAGTLVDLPHAYD